MIFIKYLNVTNVASPFIKLDNSVEANGGKEVTVEAPIQIIPVFLRAGIPVIRQIPAKTIAETRLEWILSF